jgi:two-component system, OmpR family, KDP operon response regulator KdpE
MTRVLVVDDEPQIVRALRINLRARQYDVDAAGDGASALRAATRHPPDLVVLDLGLPDMEGAEVIAGLRGWTSVPIIVLSGRVGSADKVAALDAGADDYVTKPFGIDELLARIRAVTRRVRPADEGPAVAIGPHSVDLAARSIIGGDTDIRLTPRNGNCSNTSSATPASSSASAPCCTMCGVRSTRPRPTTSGSTWPACGASSRPTRPTRDTC